MPLLDPRALTKVLQMETQKPDKTDLVGALENNRLSVSDLVGELGDLARGADSDSVRLQAVKTGLELHKALGDDGDKPIINIIIRDSQVGSINPILIPR